MSLPNSFFRQLGPAEALKFKQWARENYKAGAPINEIWHPVVRDECRKMNEELEVLLEQHSQVMTLAAHVAETSQMTDFLLTGKDFPSIGPRRAKLLGDLIEQEDEYAERIHTLTGMWV